jgi:hypothetical protein
MEGSSIKATKVIKHSEEETKAKSTSKASAAHPMRILTVSSLGAVFYRLEEGSGAIPSTLVEEKSYPQYLNATLGKFAPYAGRLAVIADPIGLHVVDCAVGKELRLIPKMTTISAMSISPRDSYLITCEKFVQGEKNLIVWDIARGVEVG